MTDAQHIEDLKAMISADIGHLAAAISKGQRVKAHAFVDSIIDGQRELEELKAGTKVYQAQITQPQIEA